MRLIGILISMIGLVLMLSALNMNIYGPYALGQDIISQEKLSFRALICGMGCCFAIIGVLISCFSALTSCISRSDKYPKDNYSRILSNYVLLNHNNYQALDVDEITRLAMNYRNAFPFENSHVVIRIKSLEIAKIINELPAYLVPEFERVLRERLELFKSHDENQSDRSF